MECSLSTVYALALMPGVDPEDLRFGQLTPSEHLEPGKIGVANLIRQIA